MPFPWWNEHTLGHHHALSLDIGSESIKFLGINAKQFPSRIEHFSIVSLPSGAVEKNEIKEPTVISAILKDMFKYIGLKDKYVVIAVPRSNITVKTITIDARLTEYEIESRAWIEANHHFPELIGGIYLDYKILGPSATDPSQVELMMVACRKDQIDPYLDVLKQSNLIPKQIDVNCYALARALLASADDKANQGTTALLNLDLTLSSLVVVHEGAMIYAQDHGYDGHRLMARVQDYLTKEAKTEAHATEMVSVGNNVEEKQPVEAGKKDPATDTAYHEILREHIISQLRHAMHFFYSSRPNITLQKLVLAGDCAVIPGLAEFLHQEIGIETTVANPFTKMDFGSKINKDEVLKHAPTLMLCYGLALDDTTSQINLLPWREQKRKAKKIQLAITTGVMAAASLIIAIVIHFFLAALVANQQDRNNFLQTTLNQEQTIMHDLQKEKKEVTALKSKLHFLMKLQINSNNVVKMLSELERIIPSPVSLTMIDQEGDKVTLTGLAASDLDITLFLQKISASSVFTTPVLTEISAQKEGPEGEKIFKLNLQQR